jgi:UDP-glucose 4-epimerase
MLHSGRPSIVVYGGTGFIGGNFANYAARLGARVVACGNALAPSSVLDAKVEVVQLDAADLNASLDLLRKTRPVAVVFGISGITPRAGKDVDPAAAFLELRSLANVIQGARDVGVRQIVFCSSGGAIYGDGAASHLETDVCAPKSLYGKLKLQAETLMTTLCEPLGIRASIMRIGNPYGPGQSPFGLHGVIAVFVYKMLTAEPITIFGSLEATKDYVYVDDVSAAIWASIERQVSGVFNIASGVPTSLRALVKKTSDVCAVEPTIKYVELAATEVQTFKLDIAKARRDLQWRAVTGMESGIAVTKRWIEETYLKKGCGPGLGDIHRISRDIV